MIIGFGGTNRIVDLMQTGIQSGDIGVAGGFGRREGSRDVFEVERDFGKLRFLQMKGIRDAGDLG